MVFLVFFLVLYGIMMYGMIFTAQQSLNLAAQDGARKALQWQAGAGHMQLRADAARAMALQQADWITAVSGAPLAVAVCGSGGPLSATADAACSGLALADDQLEVIVKYSYGAHPLIPNLPLIARAMVPDFLQARASVRLSDLAGAEGA
ncbi:TadE/TadG family type IV pilus assembly protein [Bordetella petrii]|uniref:TadE/TadG family type IV pilus assembly protein n=1 Tax=Bordetella petrii TaxID=94624 RepID=UPI001E2E39DA|nr:TadE/TadG family type IV pilus assembly protein [Bordetella petrii]MCD0505526.1 pilus assembly protein [Bordetella petrii]